MILQNAVSGKSALLGVADLRYETESNMEAMDTIRSQWGLS